jgi:hypothetical protein
MVMAIHSNKVKLINKPIPNFHKRLFWDWNFSKIDWEKHYLAVIDRIIERGDKDDWKELVRYYGKPKVVKALKSEIKYLPDYIIDDVCGYFDLQKEAIACYAHKQSRRGHWI